MKIVKAKIKSRAVNHGFKGKGKKFIAQID